MDKVIGYTTGVFDMFHVGHLRLLKQAKLHCDHLIVGVSSDELVVEYKRKAPIIPLKDRLEIINSIRWVDEVVVQSDRNKYKQFLDIGYQILFVGDDWRGHPLWVDLEGRLAQHGARVKYFPYTKGVSSTQFQNILEKIVHTEVD